MRACAEDCCATRSRRHLRVVGITAAAVSVPSPPPPPPLRYTSIVKATIRTPDEIMDKLIHEEMAIAQSFKKKTEENRQRMKKYWTSRRVS